MLTDIHNKIFIYQLNENVEILFGKIGHLSNRSNLGITNVLVQILYGNSIGTSLPNSIPVHDLLAITS